MEPTGRAGTKGQVKPGNIKSFDVSKVINACSIAVSYWYLHYDRNYDGHHLDRSSIEQLDHPKE